MHVRRAADCDRCGHSPQQSSPRRLEIRHGILRWSGHRTQRTRSSATQPDRSASNSLRRRGAIRSRLAHRLPRSAAIRADSFLWVTTGIDGTRPSRARGLVADAPIACNADVRRHVRRRFCAASASPAASLRLARLARWPAKYIPLCLALRMTRRATLLAAGTDALRIALSLTRPAPLRIALSGARPRALPGSLRVAVRAAIRVAMRRTLLVALRSALPRLRIAAVRVARTVALHVALCFAVRVARTVALHVALCFAVRVTRTVALHVALCFAVRVARTVALHVALAGGARRSATTTALARSRALALRRTLRRACWRGRSLRDRLRALRAARVRLEPDRSQQRVDVLRLHLDHVAALERRRHRDAARSARGSAGSPSGRAPRTAAAPRGCDLPSATTLYQWFARPRPRRHPRPHRTSRDRRRARRRSSSACRLLVGQSAHHAHRVLALHFVARMHQAIRELARVREQQQAFGVVVEAADAIHLPLPIDGSFSNTVGAALGIVARDDLARRACDTAARAAAARRSASSPGRR